MGFSQTAEAAWISVAEGKGSVAGLARIEAQDIGHNLHWRPGMWPGGKKNQESKMGKQEKRAENLLKAWTHANKIYITKNKLKEKRYKKVRCSKLHGSANRCCDAPSQATGSWEGAGVMVGLPLPRYPHIFLYGRCLRSPSIFSSNPFFSPCFPLLTSSSMQHMPLILHLYWKIRKLVC